ncbi:MAG: hypothetical protein OK456_08665 [Thaumarchaeota archaeon]|nr:hypothetical protein [Nitrososphaerota archaeon]
MKRDGGPQSLHGVGSANLRSGSLKAGMMFFCSILPFAYFAGAILPISAFVPLSLIWTFSGRRWFLLASTFFFALRIPDLQGVSLFLSQALKTLGMDPVSSALIMWATAGIVLSLFLFETWLLKRWITTKVSRYAPRLLARA